MKTRESGMSLVELLAVLALVSLVTVLIWTTFSISSKHNSVETQKMKLQQEANYISSELQRLHRVCKEYDLYIEASRIYVRNCLDDQNRFQDFNISEVYYYSVGKPTSYPPGSQNQVAYDIEPGIEDLEIDDFRIIDRKNTNLQVSLPLTIYRYRD